MGPSDEALAMADALIAATPKLQHEDRYSLGYAIMDYWQRERDMVQRD